MDWSFGNEDLMKILTMFFNNFVLFFTNIHLLKISCYNILFGYFVDVEHAEFVHKLNLVKICDIIYICY